MIDRCRKVQRVLLLGGTSDIGLALVRRLGLQPGASVVLAGRDVEALEVAAGLLRAEVDGVIVETEPFYAEDLAEVEPFMDRVFKEPVDLVIPAFGVLPDQARAEREPLYAAEVMMLNTVAPVTVLVAASQHLRRQGGGALIVLSSLAAVRPRRANFIFGASKAGFDAAGRGFNTSLAGTGVRVVVVRPGFVIGRMTRRTPAGPLATTADAVAAATVRALHSGRDVVWVPRAIQLVAAGFRVLPDAMWHRLPRYLPQEGRWGH